MRASFREMLEAHGCRVLEAGTGRQALEHLLSRDDLPSVILLDLAMPEMDGNKLLELLWSYSRLSDIPVIVISGTDPVRMPLSRPVARRLVKPVRDELLLRAMDEVSGRADSAR